MKKVFKNIFGSQMITTPYKMLFERLFLFFTSFIMISINPVFPDTPSNSSEYLLKMIQDNEKEFEQNPRNDEITWKLSRDYSDYSETLKNAQERKEAQQKAIDWAKKSIKLNSTNSKGHLYLAISLGRSVEHQGAKEKIRLSKEIKAEAQKAVELNPEEYLAWHILGCWNHEMATLNWVERKFADLFLGGLPKDASLEKAVECFTKAIQINPNVIAQHLELGKTYEALHLNEKASLEYETVIKLPLYDAADPKYKEEAKKLLKKLK